MHEYQRESTMGRECQGAVHSRCEYADTFVCEEWCSLLLSLCRCVSPRTQFTLICMCILSEIHGTEPYFPPRLELLQAWSTLFRCAGTWQNYVGYLKTICLLVGAPMKVHGSFTLKSISVCHYRRYSMKLRRCTKRSARFGPLGCLRQGVRCGLI